MNASNPATAVLSDPAKVVLNISGAVFGALAHIKDDVDSLGCCLTGLSNIKAVANECIGQGNDLSTSPVVENAMEAIDITRVFSGLHYIFSGEFAQDWALGRDGKCFSALFNTMADGISSFSKIQQVVYQSDEEPEDRVGHERCDSSVKGLVELFKMTAGVAEIKDDIQTLIESKAKDVGAWLGLGSTILSVALPILGLCGVTSVPVIAGIGVASFVLQIARSIYEYMEQQEANAASLNFSDGTGNLVTVTSPVSPTNGLATELSYTESAKPLTFLADTFDAFGQLSSGLNIITRLKEWFAADPKDDMRFWQKQNPWEITNKVFLTLQSGMDAVGLLNSTKVIDINKEINFSVGRVSIFKTVRASFSAIAALFEVIKRSIDLHTGSADLKKVARKQRQWQVLSRAVAGELKEKGALIAKYEEKIIHLGLQTDYMGFTTHSEALQEAIAALQENNWDSFVNAKRKLNQINVKIQRTTLEDKLANNGVVVDDSAAALGLELLKPKVKKDLLSFTTPKCIEHVAKLTEELMVQAHASNELYVQTKLDKHEARYQNVMAERAKIGLKITGNLLKIGGVALSITSSALGLPAYVKNGFTLGMHSFNVVKFLVENGTKKAPEPTLVENFMAAAAA